MRSPIVDGGWSERVAHDAWIQRCNGFHGKSLRKTGEPRSRSRGAANWVALSERRFSVTVNPSAPPNLKPMLKERTERTWDGRVWVASHRLRAYQRH